MHCSKQVRESHDDQVPNNSNGMNEIDGHPSVNMASPVFKKVFSSSLVFFIDLILEHSRADQRSARDAEFDGVLLQVTVNDW